MDEVSDFIRAMIGYIDRERPVLPIVPDGKTFALTVNPNELGAVPVRAGAQTKSVLVNDQNALTSYTSVAVIPATHS
jgi:hypothetical protein